MVLLAAALVGLARFCSAAGTTPKPNILWLIRNYEPQRPHFQRMACAEATNPACNRMRQLFAEGKLNAEQSRFMASSRPHEELYDLQDDPFELHNLAEDPAHRAILDHFRKQLDAWIADTHDQGATREDPETGAEDLKRNEAADKKLRVPQQPAR
jgi:arylsulfatase A-like enzyme